MRKIAVLNQKGGVGKTTTAVNLSAALARRGRRVCLTDLDPQAHASLHLSSSLRDARLPDRNLYDVFIHEANLRDITQAAGNNLWVIPSGIDLSAVEMEMAGVAGREVILRQKLPLIENDYDVLMIDCPPSLGILTLNALTAADEVFIPLQPHFLALHGLSKLLETINLVSQRLNSQLRLSGVLLCMFESGTRLAKEVAGDVGQFFSQDHEKHTPWAAARLFETKIRRNIKLAEAPSYGQSIFDYAANSPGAQDYDALADEVMEQMMPPSQFAVTHDEFLSRMGELSQPRVA